MKFSLILTALLSTVIASPLTHDHEKRDAAAVTSAIANVNTQLSAFNSSLNTFGDSPSVTTALAVQTASNNVKSALQSATSAANSSAPFDDAGSAQVATAILNLQPNINSTLDNVIAKHAAFEGVAAGALVPTVKSNLQDQKALAQSFGDAVTAKLTSQYAAQAPAINQQIQAKFDQAIAAYS